MKLFLKVVFFLIVVLVVLFFVFNVADTDQQTMIAKYGQGAIEVDDGIGGRFITVIKVIRAARCCCLFIIVIHQCKHGIA